MIGKGWQLKYEKKQQKGNKRPKRVAGQKWEGVGCHFGGPTIYLN